MTIAPVPHVYLQLLLFIITGLTALCAQDLIEGCDIPLELYDRAHVCLKRSGSLLNLFLECFECILKSFSLRHLSVLSRIIKIFILCLLLHVPEVCQRFCSVCLSLLSCFRRVPDRRLDHFGRFILPCFCCTNRRLRNFFFLLIFLLKQLLSIWLLPLVGDFIDAILESSELG